jgi:predicted transcriptional regulator
LKKPSSLFSKQQASFNDDPSPVTCVDLQTRTDSRRPAGNSLWLSQKMVEEGCTLGQTLQVMEERCKNCSVISPMLCMDQCDTWKVKKELRETTRILSETDHDLRLLNALKNDRRLTMLKTLAERPLTFDQLQGVLRRQDYHHSRKTIRQYLQPLIETGLVEERDKRFRLTLYGGKINEAVVKHSFSGHLPIHSDGHEERILRSLLASSKARDELLQIASAKSMSRTLVQDTSPSDRVFYFPTKRASSLEMLSPTQKRLHDAIPQAGISARGLSRAGAISLRRVYKYLRNLRGKKLVFRRDIPPRYELTERGQAVACFLEEVTEIK